MADDESRRRAWEVVAKSRGKALASPVIRSMIGMGGEELGRSGRHQLPPAPTRVDANPGSRLMLGPATQDSARDELLRRMLTRDKVGYGVPGPGVLTAAALRPDVRALFEDQGGVIGIDITDMPPAVASELALLLDHEWAAKMVQ